MLNMQYLIVARPLPHVRIAKDCLPGAMVLYLDCMSVGECWRVYSFNAVTAVRVASCRSTVVRGLPTAARGPGEGLAVAKFQHYKKFDLKLKCKLIDIYFIYYNFLYE